MRRTAYDDIDWHVPPEDPADLDLSRVAAPDEPGRKFLVEGESGFYVQTVRLPAGFEAPVHHHSHAEVFLVLEGSCVFNGEPMRPYDVAVVDADERYGFTAGDEGVQFLVTRQGRATFAAG